MQNGKSAPLSSIDSSTKWSKKWMNLYIRIVEMTRATIKIGLANLVHNIKRLIFLRLEMR